MPSSGKSTFLSVILERRYPVLLMGDVIREEAEKQGLPPTAENLGSVAIEIRRREGRDAVARRCILKLNQAKHESPVVAIDGIRSLDEVETFRRVYRNVALIAVHSSPETRFMRFSMRHRSDDAESWELFRKRDLRELGFGMGDAIAMADTIIVNESTLEDLKAESRKVLEECVTRWTD